MDISKKKFNIAMLGMVEGNGHPYSWSAIINGDYDREKMEYCPYETIPHYLGQQKGCLGIEGARVTHIWTDKPEDAELVAKASKIENILHSPTDAIGEVDAAIISTDKGFEHVERARAFVEAGIPVFIDKPLTDNEEDLKTFCQWKNEGAKIMSSSCMRYAKEIKPYHLNHYELGQIRYISVAMAKKWETYGIHALEAMYPVLGAGFLSVRNIGTEERNIVHIKHKSGADIMIPVIKDMYGAFSVMQLCGTEDNVTLKFKDTYTAFRAQLLAFVDYLKTDEMPFAFSETVELIKMVIAGTKSRELGGAEIYLDDIRVEI